MPVRYLDILITERKATYVGNSASELSSTRLGIEATDWLRHIVMSLRDPCLSALGCSEPPALRDEITRHVAWFRKHNIEPLFVFPGLPLLLPNCAPHAFEDSRPRRRAAAWAAHDRDTTNPPPHYCSTEWIAATPHVSDFYPFAMKVLSSLGASYMCAPYSSLAQLYALRTTLHSVDSATGTDLTATSESTVPPLHPQSLLSGDTVIHAVYGGTDLLLYDFDCIISKIDFDSDTFDWINRTELIEELGITAEQFVDCCLLAGFDWLSTAVPSPTYKFCWRTIFEAVRRWGTGYAVATEMFRQANDSVQKTIKEAVAKGLKPLPSPRDESGDAAYLDTYAKVRCALRHHIVFAPHAGQVAPLDVYGAPDNLHEIFGPQMNRSFYFAVCGASVSSSFCSIAASTVTATFPEYSPLSGDDDKGYRAYATELARFRARIAAPLLGITQPAHSACEFWHSRNTRDMITPLTDAESQHLKNAIVLCDNFVATNSLSHTEPTLLNCLTAATEKRGPLKLQGNTTNNPLQYSDNYTVAAAVSAMLELRGYMPGGPNHARLMTILQRHSNCNGKDQESILLACELLQANMLVPKEAKKSKESKETKDPDALHMRLATRIASLIELPSNLFAEDAVRYKKWNLFSSEHIKFASVVKLCDRSLRILVEGALLAHIMRRAPYKLTDSAGSESNLTQTLMSNIANDAEVNANANPAAAAEDDSATTTQGTKSGQHRKGKKTTTRSPAAVPAVDSDAGANIVAANPSIPRPPLLEIDAGLRTLLPFGSEHSSRSAIVVEAYLRAKSELVKSSAASSVANTPDSDEFLSSVITKRLNGLLSVSELRAFITSYVEFYNIVNELASSFSTAQVGAEATQPVDALAASASSFAATSQWLVELGLPVGSLSQSQSPSQSPSPAHMLKQREQQQQQQQPPPPPNKPRNRHQ